MKFKQLTFLIVLVLILSWPTGAFCQGMPVYDNTNFIALGQSIIESAKQTSELFKTVQFLKEQKERIEEVSGVISQLQAAREIIANNQALYSDIQNDLRDILSSPYIHPGEVERISESFNRMVEIALEDMSFLENLLTSGYFKMSDAERMEMMEARRNRSRAMSQEAALKKKRYRDLIEFRRITEAINSREAQY